MRNWITEYRVDISYSSRFEALEDTYIRIAKGENEGGQKEAIFKMPKMAQQLLENFMTVRNAGLLLQKTTMDQNGKCSVMDPNTNRPLIAGDGAIPQINRFAGKYNYSKFSISVLNRAISSLVEKAKKPTGNTFAFICNEPLYRNINETLAQYLNNFRTLNNHMTSPAKDSTYKVGATYSAYEFTGKIKYCPLAA